MPRVPPHPGLQDESERWIETGLHPHEAQEVVHHVVGVIDVDPPGGRDRPRGAVFGSGRPGREHEILAAHVQREAEIRTTREPGSRAHARPGLAREHAPDVAAREHVVLYPRDEIHRILRIARTHGGRFGGGWGRGGGGCVPRGGSGGGPRPRPVAGRWGRTRQSPGGGGPRTPARPPGWGKKRTPPGGRRARHRTSSLFRRIKRRK